MKYLQTLIYNKYGRIWDGRDKVDETAFYTIFCSIVNYATSKGWNLNWNIPRFLYFLELGGIRPNISNDWFSHNIPTWFEYIPKKPLKVLEVGCFEGLSTLFLFSFFNIEEYTVVDTFEGGEEHKDKEYLISLRDRFEENLKDYIDRIKVNRMYSSTFFECLEDATYNLIYIDGSHDSEDVYLDGVSAFQYLDKGGVIIFDDYKWHLKGKEDRKPSVGVNKFMNEYWGEFEILFIDYQVILRRI